MAAQNGTAMATDGAAVRQAGGAGAEQPLRPPAGAAAPQPAFDPRSELPDAANYRLGATLTGHGDMIASVRFQRDGHLLASASADGTAKVWDAAAGREVLTLRGHADGINDVVWAWNGQTVATASNDSTVRVWDVRSGQAVRRLAAHTSYVTSCSFSAAGELLASAGYDETIRLWCMHTGKLVRSIPAHSDPIFSVDFSADLAKPVLASASNDGICRVWMTQTGECGRSIIPDPAENPCLPVTFAKFTPNNKFLLLGMLSGRLQLWDFEPRPAPSGGMAAVSVKKTYVGHRNSRHTLQAAFLVNEPGPSKYIVCGSEDRHVFLWDLNHRSIAGILRGKSSADAPGDGHCDVVHAVDTCPTEPALASGGGVADRAVKLWRYVAPGTA